MALVRGRWTRAGRLRQESRTGAHLDDEGDVDDVDDAGLGGHVGEVSHRVVGFSAVTSCPIRSGALTGR